MHNKIIILVANVLLLLMTCHISFANDTKNDIKSLRTKEVRKVASEIRKAVVNKDTQKLLQFVDKKMSGSFEGAQYSYKTMVKDFSKKGIFYCTTFDTNCLRTNYTGQSMVVGSHVYGDGEISVREFFVKYNKKITVNIRLDKGGNKAVKYGYAYITYAYLENNKSKLSAGCGISLNPADNKWYFADYLFDPE
jgi:hypothetical protein